MHVMYNMGGEEMEVGTVVFDTRNEKIVKPLAKEYFSRQFENKRGYVEYKFIAVETKVVAQE